MTDIKQTIDQKVLDILYDNGLSITRGLNDRPYLYVRDSETQETVSLVDLPGEEGEDLPGRIIRAADAFDPYAYMADLSYDLSYYKLSTTDVFDSVARLESVADSLSTEYNYPRNATFKDSLDVNVKAWYQEAFPGDQHGELLYDKLTFRQLSNDPEFDYPHDRFGQILVATTIARKEKERDAFKRAQDKINDRISELRNEHGVDPGIRALEKNGFTVRPDAEGELHAYYKNDEFKLPFGNLEISEKVVFAANTVNGWARRKLRPETTEALSKAADEVSQEVGIDRRFGRPKFHIILKDQFEQECAQYSKQYSHFMILNASEDQVVDTLNRTVRGETGHWPDEVVVDGLAENNSVSFNVFGASPDFVHDITKDLNEHGVPDAIGYANEEWELFEFVASRNGQSFDDYSAAWNDHEAIEGTETWNASFTVQDHETMATFSAGANAVDRETEQAFAKIVDSHSEHIADPWLDYHMDIDHIESPITADSFHAQQVENEEMTHPSSSYLLVGTTVEKLVEALNEIDPTLVVANGKDNPANEAVYFDIFDQNPDLVYALTEKLDCIGYADKAGQDFSFAAAKDGHSYDGFTAEWHNESHGYVPSMDSWNAFFSVTDNKSGARFYSGTGNLPREKEQEIASIVDSHSAKNLDIIKNVKEQHKEATEKKKTIPKSRTIAD